MRWTLTLRERFEEKIRKTDGCWYWIGSHNGKYGQMRVDYRLEFAHRLAWQLYIGSIPLGMCVCHRCDNGMCVRPSHLWIGTQGENLRDMVRKNRQRWNPLRGSACGTAKLTEVQVRRIKERLRDGGSSKVLLASEFGVVPSTIRHIEVGNTWSHI